jgi:hypothetical protein
LNKYRDIYITAPVSGVISTDGPIASDAGVYLYPRRGLAHRRSRVTGQILADGRANTVKPGTVNRRILTHVEETEAELTDQRSDVAGHLTVTAPVLFGQMHVVPEVSSFLARHQQARVDMLLLDRVVNLIDEGVDLAVRIAHLADSHP